MILPVSQVVSTVVYLDDLADSEAFDKVYLEYFPDVRPAETPAETIVQQLPPSSRSADAEGHYPDLEQMSLIAVKKSEK